MSSILKSGAILLRVNSKTAIHDQLPCHHRLVSHMLRLTIATAPPRSNIPTHLFTPSHRGSRACTLRNYTSHHPFQIRPICLNQAVVSRADWPLRHIPWCCEQWWWWMVVLEWKSRVYRDLHGLLEPPITTTIPLSRTCSKLHIYNTYIQLHKTEPHHHIGTLDTELTWRFTDNSARLSLE